MGAIGHWVASVGLAPMPPCVLVTDTLTPIFLEALPPGPHSVMVRLMVECPVPECPQQLLYNNPVSAPAGASLLDLLRAAPPQGSQNFTCVVLWSGGSEPVLLPPCPLRCAPGTPGSLTLLCPQV